MSSLLVSYEGYDYQGQYSEKDPVTGLNNFELRIYDARIGRWLTTDPQGQYNSPYEGMGNNPVSGTDPTGGECPDCPSSFLPPTAPNEPVTPIFTGPETYLSPQDGNTYFKDETGLWQEEHQLREVKIVGTNASNYTNTNPPNDFISNMILSYIPPPKSLPGFPDAKRIKPQGGRPKWRLPDGDIAEWDRQQGEVERYNPRGQHRGVWNPEGKRLKIQF
jgi:RHS repeat-associated protein